jgi:hypothetical protein
MGRNYYAGGTGPRGRSATGREITRTVSSGGTARRPSSEAARATSADLARLRRAARSVQGGADAGRFASLAASVRARIAARGAGVRPLRTVDALVSQAEQRASSARAANARARRS